MPRGRLLILNCGDGSENVGSQSRRLLSSDDIYCRLKVAGTHSLSLFLSVLGNGAVFRHPDSESGFFS